LRHDLHLAVARLSYAVTPWGGWRTAVLQDMAEPEAGTTQETAREVVREVSYAASAATRAGRALIRLVENATGRPGLIRRAAGYEAEVAAGRDFWAVMVERYGLRLEVFSGSLTAIPRSGPLVVVANHPFGILDGLVMGHVLAQTRGDFRILAHRVFRRAEALERVILPVSFDETKAAQRTNIATRAAALAHLADGGAIGIFPGGTVATAPRPFGAPLDPVWRGFTAKLVTRAQATVVPLYFDGHNSRLFQIASHLNYTLRMALLIREFKARVDAPVRLAVGAPIPPEALAPIAGDPRAVMDFLRAATYRLSPRLIDPRRLGHEFEARYRR
jgi:putative hemolysin